MNEWMNELMNEWKDEWLNEWITKMKKLGIDIQIKSVRSGYQDQPIGIMSIQHIPSYDK